MDKLLLQVFLFFIIKPSPGVSFDYNSVLYISRTVVTYSNISTVRMCHEAYTINIKLIFTYG